MERILIVTVADQVVQLSAQVPSIPEENYIIEPLPRGTASVVGLAALAIQSRDPQGSMAILTADHLMRNAEHLRQLLKAAYAVAQKDYLVTLGITPTFPATGYGYIEKGEALGILRAWKLSGCKPSRKNHSWMLQRNWWPMGTMSGILACSFGRCRR